MLCFLFHIVVVIVVDAYAPAYPITMGINIAYNSLHPKSVLYDVLYEDVEYYVFVRCTEADSIFFLDCYSGMRKWVEN